MNIECLFGKGGMQAIGAYTLEGTTSSWEEGVGGAYNSLWYIGGRGLGGAHDEEVLLIQS